MAAAVKLNQPWMVAVWPGMGHVAISAGYYLMAKLGMHILSEFPAHELFDVEHVEVKDGLISTGRLPRSRFFVWEDPLHQRDIVVFIGEAQPSKGRYAFCHRLIDYAKTIGVSRIYTFAAMATDMDHEAESRVFAAATDSETLREFKDLDLHILDDGNIGGLNGILLGAAGEIGMRGGCLLGEMPHIFAQLPYPKASMAVLKAFSTTAKIDIDLAELSEQAREMDEKLRELLAQMQNAIQHGGQPEEEHEETTDEAIRREAAEEEKRQNEEKLQGRQGENRATVRASQTRPLNRLRAEARAGSAGGLS